MYCSRAQNRIRSQECSGIILSTEDNRHFDMCRMCPEGLRLIATVRFLHNEENTLEANQLPEDTDMEAVNVTSPTKHVIPETATELAAELGVRIDDVYATFKRLRAGCLPARGKAAQIAERMAAWGIGPDHFCRKNRAAAAPAASPAAPAPVESITPVVPQAETCAPDPKNDKTPQAVPQAPAQSSVPDSITSISLESLVAEIQRRVPKAVVVLR